MNSIICRTAGIRSYPTASAVTYDLAPEMSAQEICDTLAEKIHSGEYDMIVANFANRRKRIRLLE